MQVDAALRAFLLGFPGIVDRVEERITPQPLPQGSRLPAITYQDIPTESFSYSSSGQNALVKYRYQIDCWAETREAASELETFVRQLLSGFQGQWSGGVRVGSVFAKSRWTLRDPHPNLWRAIAEYQINVFEC